MHILFLDESGTCPGRNNKRHKYFVIGGLAIPEGKWSRMRDALLGMKRRRGLRGEIKWRYFAPDNTEQANPMKAMSSAERCDIRTEIYEGIICAEKSVKSLACVTCVEAAYKMPTATGREMLYHYTYKPLSERFQYHLQDLSRSVGRPEYGIIVSDHRGANDDKSFRLQHEKLLYEGGDFVSKYPNLIESLFFIPSHLSIGIQLADMVAGAVWRKYETGDDRWFNMLRPSIRCSRGGAIDGYGIVKFPKATFA